MPDLTASNVTVTVERRAIEGKTRRNRVKIAFGDGALTYPAGGVPMPPASAFGMKVRLDYLTIFDYDDASGIVWKYDKENKKLRAYVQGAAVGAAAAGTPDDFTLTAGYGVTSSAMVWATGSTTHRFGGLIESASGAGTGNAPPATVLYAEAVGW